MISFSTFSLEHYVWQDRFSWSGIFQQEERALNGDQHIEPSVVTVGRPITLLRDVEEFAVFNTLHAHSIANQEAFMLTINGTDYNVIWIHRPLAVSGQPINNFSDADPTHFSEVKLTFITV